MIVDTGANRTSIMSLSQYKAYCHEFSVPSTIRPTSKYVNGIGGCQKSIGVATINVPFPQLNVFCDIEFYIIDNDATPTLWSLRDLKSSGIDLSIQKNQLTYMNQSCDLEFENDLLVYRWNSYQVFYTYSELRKLHRSFGHPSVGALLKILKRARSEDVSPETEYILEEIRKSCKTCSELGRKPRRFKLTVGHEDSQFNHTVAIDVMYLSGKPVLHLLDEATHFQSAVFLKNQKSSTIWTAILTGPMSM